MDLIVESTVQNIDGKTSVSTNNTDVKSLLPNNIDNDDASIEGHNQGTTATNGNIEANDVSNDNMVNNLSNINDNVVPDSKAIETNKTDDVINSLMDVDIEDVDASTNDNKEIITKEKDSSKSPLPTSPKYAGIDSEERKSEEAGKVIKDDVNQMVGIEDRTDVIKDDDNQMVDIEDSLKEDLENVKKSLEKLGESTEDIHGSKPSTSSQENNKSSKNIEINNTHKSNATNLISDSFYDVEMMDLENKIIESISQAKLSLENSQKDSIELQQKDTVPPLNGPEPNSKEVSPVSETETKTSAKDSKDFKEPFKDSSLSKESLIDVKESAKMLHYIDKINDSKNETIDKPPDIFKDPGKFGNNGDENEIKHNEMEIDISDSKTIEAFNDGFKTIEAFNDHSKTIEAFNDDSKTIQDFNDDTKIVETFNDDSKNFIDEESADMEDFNKKFVEGTNLISEIDLSQNFLETLVQNPITQKSIIDSTSSVGNDLITADLIATSPEIPLETNIEGESELNKKDCKDKDGPDISSSNIEENLEQNQLNKMDDIEEEKSLENVLKINEEDTVNTLAVIKTIVKDSTDLHLEEVPQKENLEVKSEIKDSSEVNKDDVAVKSNENDSEDNNIEAKATSPIEMNVEENVKDSLVKDTIKLINSKKNEDPENDSKDEETNLSASNVGEENDKKNLLNQNIDKHIPVESTTSTDLKQSSAQEVSNVSQSLSEDLNSKEKSLTKNIDENIDNIIDNKYIDEMKKSSEKNNSNENEITLTKTIDNKNENIEENEKSCEEKLDIIPEEVSSVKDDISQDGDVEMIIPDNGMDLNESQNDSQNDESQEEMEEDEQEQENEEDCFRNQEKPFIYDHKKSSSITNGSGCVSSLVDGDRFSLSDSSSQCSNREDPLKPTQNENIDLMQHSKNESTPNKIVNKDDPSDEVQIIENRNSPILIGSDSEEDKTNDNNGNEKTEGDQMEDDEKDNQSNKSEGSSKHLNFPEPTSPSNFRVVQRYSSPDSSTSNIPNPFAQVGISPESNDEAHCSSDRNQIARILRRSNRLNEITITRVPSDQSVVTTIDLLDSSDEDNNSSKPSSTTNPRKPSSPSVSIQLVTKNNQNSPTSQMKRTLLSNREKQKQQLQTKEIAKLTKKSPHFNRSPKTNQPKPPRSATPQSQFLDNFNLLPSLHSTSTKSSAVPANASASKPKETKNISSTNKLTLSPSFLSKLIESKDAIYSVWLEEFLDHFTSPQEIVQSICFSILQMILKSNIELRIRIRRTMLNQQAVNSNDPIPDSILMRDIRSCFFSNGDSLTQIGFRFCEHVTSDKFHRNTPLTQHARTFVITTRICTIGEMAVQVAKKQERLKKINNLFLIKNTSEKGEVSGLPKPPATTFNNNNPSANCASSRKRKSEDRDYAPKSAQGSNDSCSEPKRSLRTKRTKKYDDSFTYNEDQFDFEDEDENDPVVIERKIEQKRLEAQLQRQQQAKSFENDYIDVFARSNQNATSPIINNAFSSSLSIASCYSTSPKSSASSCSSIPSMPKKSNSLNFLRNSPLIPKLPAEIEIISLDDDDDDDGGSGGGGGHSGARAAGGNEKLSPPGLLKKQKNQNQNQNQHQFQLSPQLLKQLANRQKPQSSRLLTSPSSHKQVQQQQQQYIQQQQQHQQQQLQQQQQQDFQQYSNNFQKHLQLMQQQKHLHHNQHQYQQNQHQRQRQQQHQHQHHHQQQEQIQPIHQQKNQPTKKSSNHGGSSSSPSSLYRQSQGTNSPSLLEQATQLSQLNHNQSKTFQNTFIESMVISKVFENFEPKAHQILKASSLNALAGTATGTGTGMGSGSASGLGSPKKFDSKIKSRARMRKQQFRILNEEPVDVDEDDDHNVQANSNTNANINTNINTNANTNTNGNDIDIEINMPVEFEALLDDNQLPSTSTQVTSTTTTPNQQAPTKNFNHSLEVIFTDPSFAPKNIDRNLHIQSKIRRINLCVICKSNPKNIVDHYVNCHRGCEVYIARISSKQLRTLKAPSTSSQIKHNINGLYTFTCIFCHKTLSMNKISWEEHYTTHTGEYCYECTACNYRQDQQIGHVRHCSRKGEMVRFQEISNPEQTNMINLYNCTLCNYVQLQMDNLKNHIKFHHNIKLAINKHIEKLTLLDFTKSTFDPYYQEGDQNEQNYNSSPEQGNGYSYDDGNLLHTTDPNELDMAFLICNRLEANDDPSVNCLK